MKPSSILPRLGLAAAVFFSVWSCSENLDSSGVCDVLCPSIGGSVKTDTIDAVTIDTTVQSFTGLGTELGLLLANRGDTLDTRVIIRFDTLPQKFTHSGEDTAQTIKSVDSAYVLLHLDTLSIKGSDAVTIEAYDVDTTAADTSAAAVLALFRPDRFISSQTFVKSQLSDSVKYFIDNATVLSKIQNGAHLRIGLRATGSSSSQLTFGSTEAGFSPILFFRATPDTATQPLTAIPFSSTPTGESIVAQHLADYTVIAKAPPEGDPTLLAVGGLLPPRRVYVRFDIPSKYVDSSTIVRATLLLNQIPNNALDPGDTILVVPQVVLAGTAVTDATKAAQIIANISADTLKLTPGHDGNVEVELASAFSLWRATKPDTLPRAIVLKSNIEGVSPIELRFSSSEDIAALRPRLRISYTKQVPLGLP